MALIKCKECGKEISDKANECIHCGCPVENETKYYCEECGKEILKTNKVCSNCGCPIKFKSKEENSSISISTKMWLIICIILCFLISGINFFNIFNIYTQKMIVIVGNLNINIMGILALMLGVSYIFLLITLSKKSLYALFGINALILIYNLFNIGMIVNLFYIILVLMNSLITFFIVRKKVKGNKFSFKEYLPIFIVLIVVIVLIMVGIIGSIILDNNNKLVCIFQTTNNVGTLDYKITYTFSNDGSIKTLQGHQYTLPNDKEVAEALWTITNNQQDQYNYYDGLSYKATFSENKEITLDYSINAEKAPNMFNTISGLSGIKGIKNDMSKNEIKIIYEENDFTCK